MRQRRSINVDYLNDEEIKNAEAKLLNKTDDHDNNNKISNNNDTSIFGEKGTLCYWIAITMFNLAMILFLVQPQLRIKLKAVNLVVAVKAFGIILLKMVGQKMVKTERSLVNIFIALRRILIF